MSRSCKPTWDTRCTGHDRGRVFPASDPRSSGAGGSPAEDPIKPFVVYASHLAAVVLAKRKSSSPQLLIDSRGLLDLCLPLAGVFTSLGAYPAAVCCRSSLAHKMPERFAGLLRS